MRRWISEVVEAILVNILAGLVEYRWIIGSTSAGHLTVLMLSPIELLKTLNYFLSHMKCVCARVCVENKRL